VPHSGAGLAPLHAVDALLGGSPLVDDLVRHADVGETAVIVRGDVLERRTIVRATPLPYGDTLGVRRVLADEEAGRVEGPVAAAALTAWTSATVGYLAGLGGWALDQAVAYTLQRKAFGSVLAVLDPVQQRLADAATIARGLQLAAEEGAGAAVLAYAGPAAVELTAACQQVVGAIGFTLEFPLQRAFRRARALQVWTDAILR
jgi:hypothetical protein